MKKALVLVLVIVCGFFITACEGINITTRTTKTVEVTIDNSDEYDNRLEIKDFESSLDGKKLYCYAHVHNPNEEYALMYPLINLKVLDSNGKLLNPGQTSRGFGVSSILPNGDCWGVWAIDVDGVPTTIEIDVSAPEKLCNYLVLAKKEYRKIQMNILNTELKKDEYPIKMVGEIENKSSVSIREPCLVVVFRNGSGSIVGYGKTLLSDIPAHETNSFSQLLVSIEGRTTNDYEVYVNASRTDVEEYSEAGEDWISDVLRSH